MSEQALEASLLNEGMQKMQEISREEILKQIFGDIGELADGLWLYFAFIFCMLNITEFFWATFRFHVRGRKHSPTAWENVHH
jgi:hypothetical protein